MSWYSEVIVPDPRFHSPNRCADLGLLFPPFRRKVQAVLSDALAHGVRLMVFETYRSPARQHLLFEQGATQLRQVGVHGYGLACDAVFSIDGEPSWKGDFSRWVGHLGKVHNLVWGGDWFSPKTHPSHYTSFPDLDHLQFIAVADQAKLFRGEWYPSDLYVPE